MRRERDSFQTDAKAQMVENGILRMRLATATERTASADSEARGVPRGIIHHIWSHGPQ